MAKISPLQQKMATSDSSMGVSMDLARYATKKSIAQGMLDIALLTANLSQLKYVLQVGQRHEFYTLLLYLLSMSIFLQMSTGCLNLSMVLLRDCRVSQERHEKSSSIIHYIVTSSAFFVTALNLLISAFDPTILRYIDVTP